MARGLEGPRRERDSKRRIFSVSVQYARPCWESDRGGKEGGGGRNLVEVETMSSFRRSR